MESVIEKLRIQTIAAELAVSRIYAEALALRFQEARSCTEKMTIAGQYGEALKQARSLELLLEMAGRGSNQQSSQ
jgi:hypothetical protein